MSHLQLKLLESAKLASDPEEQRRFSAEAREVDRDLKEVRTSLRQYSEKGPSILAQAGRTWVADDVVAAWETMHQVIAAGVRGLYRKERARLRACANADEEDEHWQSAVDSLFSGYLASEFAKLPESDVAVPA